MAQFTEDRLTTFTCKHQGKEDDSHEKSDRLID